MNDYQATSQFWDKVFRLKREYNITAKLKNEQLDEAIEWVSNESESVLDFGCGNGLMLFRCLLNENVKNVLGIDLSMHGIISATRLAGKNKLRERTKFLNGGVDELKKLDDNSFDSCILSNILDNLTPKDSKTVLDEIKRIVKDDGKILIKLNPYITKENQEEFDFKKIDEDFFLEPTGLFLWNLNDENIKNLLSKYFKIEKQEEIYYKEHDMINRVFFLRNN